MSNLSSRQFWVLVWLSSQSSSQQGRSGCPAAPESLVALQDFACIFCPSYGVWLAAGLCCVGAREPSIAVSLGCGLRVQASSRGATVIIWDSPGAPLPWISWCMSHVAHRMKKIRYHVLGFIPSHLIPIRTKPSSSVILSWVTWFSCPVGMKNICLTLEGVMESKETLKRQWAKSSWEDDKLSVSPTASQTAQYPPLAREAWYAFSFWLNTVVINLIK